MLREREHKTTAWGDISLQLLTSDGDKAKKSLLFQIKQESPCFLCLLSTWYCSYELLIDHKSVTALSPVSPKAL